MVSDDGGAFPEIHVAQFPLNLGRKAGGGSSTVVALQTDKDGKVQYDAVIKQGLSNRLAIHVRPEATRPQWSKPDELKRPTAEDEAENQEKTRAALELALSNKLAKGSIRGQVKEPEYIKYTPNQQAPGHSLQCSQRVIRMVENQVDPMEPPKFKHKRIPRGPPSPPPAVLHSPPRKLTAQDQAEWKIPPCVSNWKNQKGYTIPLDKRLQADGRLLQDVSINDKFASLSEALYIAERAAREEIRIRNEMVKQKKHKEETVREQQLREVAAKARAERSTITAQFIAPAAKVGDDALAKRRQMEKDRKRDLERGMRLERAGKKSKRTRDEDRDISEKIALGQAKPTNQESLIDSRLFNQSSGMDSGFEGGDDEKYNVYDKPLFSDRSSQGIYRFERDRMAESVGEGESMPAFSGADAERQRTAPVEFEKDIEDPFGLDSLIATTKKR